MGKETTTLIKGPTKFKRSNRIERVCRLAILGLGCGFILAGCAAPQAAVEPEVNSPEALETSLSEPLLTNRAKSAAATAGGPKTSSPAAPAATETAPPATLDPGMIVAAHEEILNRIYHTALPSVALIRVSKNLSRSQTIPERRDSPPMPGLPDQPRDFYSLSGGSGFIWDDAGHVVTNHHVIEGADRVTVVLADGIELEAEVLGSDPDSDLAVVKVEPPEELIADESFASVTLGDSDAVVVGQVAAALGNPFGQQFSITSGIISGVGRTIRSGNSPFSIPEVLQTDAPINPGNSGGPLLDRHGQVIGVNTQIISRSGSSSGIGFAVPINIAKRVVPALISDGHYDYSWLGISGSSLRPDVAELMDLPRETRGALTTEVAPDGPAEQAGLQGSDQVKLLEGREIPVGGDVITAIDGVPVKGIDDIIAYLVGYTEPGQIITLDVIRKGEREELRVTLGTRPGSL